MKIMTKQENIYTQKKGGRPKLESYKKRRHQYKLSYNDSEQEIAEAKAKENNRTFKRWLHDAPLELKGKPHLDEENTGYVRKVAGMANNVNQIAHKANAEGVSPVESLALEVLTLLYTLLTRILRGGDLSKD